MEARQKPGASSNGVSASPTVDMCAFRVCGQVGPPRRLPVAPAAPRRNSGRAAVHLSGLWTGGTRLGLAVPARGTPCARASWGDSSPVAPWGQPVTPRGRPATREAVHNSTGCTPRPTRLRRGLRGCAAAGRMAPRASSVSGGVSWCLRSPRRTVRLGARRSRPRPRGATPAARPCTFRACGRVGAAPTPVGRARGPHCARASWDGGRPATPRGCPVTREAVHNSGGCTPRPVWLRRGCSPPWQNPRDSARASTSSVPVLARRPPRLQALPTRESTPKASHNVSETMKTRPYNRSFRAG